MAAIFQCHRTQKQKMAKSCIVSNACSHNVTLRLDVIDTAAVADVAAVTRQEQ
jgi:hypothetical protein